MSRLLAALGMLLLCACSTNKYTAMPDGSKPVLYPASTVLSWPMVDGAHQAPSGRARISIDESARLESGVQVGDGVRIGAKVFMDEDATLMPNVSVGDETWIGDDVIVGSNVKIGHRVTIGGDAKIGAGSVVEDGALVGAWAKVGNRVTIGRDAKVGVGSMIGDGATIARSQVIAQGSRISAPK
jgi:UDP-3-O-[3-hydroxymyristoyl] glucosamine N-acyltransferase